MNVSLTVWPEMIHVFQAFPGSVIPEADQSIAAIGLVPGRCVRCGGPAVTGHLTADRPRPTHSTDRHREDLRHAGIPREDSRGDRGRQRDRTGAEPRHSPPKGCGWPWPTSTARHCRGRPSWSEPRFPSCEVMSPDLRRERGRSGRPAGRLPSSTGGARSTCCATTPGYSSAASSGTGRPRTSNSCFGANLWGILNGIRAFVPRMIAQGTEGHVVNTSSVAGLLGAPFEAPYAVSKFAAFAATESLAHDLEAVGFAHQGLGALPGHDHHQHRRLRPSPARPTGHRGDRGPEVRVRLSGPGGGRRDGPGRGGPHGDRRPSGPRSS